MASFYSFIKKQKRRSLISIKVNDSLGSQPLLDEITKFYYVDIRKKNSGKICSLFDKTRFKSRAFIG